MNTNTLNTNTLSANTLTTNTLSVSGNINGILATPNQPNITAVGTLTGLSVNGALTASNAIFNNLSVTTSLSGVLNTPIQPNITSLGPLTQLTVSGNATFLAPVEINQLTVNGNSQLGTVTGQSVKTYANVLDDGSGNATFANNVTISNLNVTGQLTGTLTTPNQSNITSVGALTGLIVNGNVTINGNATINGNVLTSGYLQTTYNFSGTPPLYPSQGFIVGWNLTGGNGETDFIAIQGAGSVGGFRFYNYESSTLTNIATLTGSGNFSIAGNLTAGSTTVSSLTSTSNTLLANANGSTVKTYHNTLDDGSGNVTISGSLSAGATTVSSLTSTGNITGTLATASQPNITSVGTLTGLKVRVTGTTAVSPVIGSVIPG